MSEALGPNAIVATTTSRGWVILSVGIAALIGMFLLWLGVGLLSSAGNVVGGAFSPMNRSSLTDAQTFYVLITYVFSLVSFTIGLFVLLLCVRRLLA